MQRLLSGSLTVSVLLGLPSPVQADEKARAIVEKAIAAHGGEAQLAKLKVMRWGGNMTGGGLTATWEQTWQWPDQMKDVQEVKGVTLKTQVFNGKNLWIRSDGNTREVQGKELDMYREEIYVEMFDRLVPLLDKSYELTALDEIQIEGRPAVGVKLASKRHRDVKLFFDKKSGLLVKRENELRNDEGKLVRLEMFYSDHKETDGLKLHRKALALVDGKKFAEFTVTEVQFFKKLDDSVFAKP